MKYLDKHLSGRKSLCFLDLEGTQFSHEMIAIGAVKVSIRKNGSIRKYHKGYYSLVKPKNRIGKIVTDLTGITENDVKNNGISFRKAVQDIKKYMGKDFNKTLYVTFGNHDQRIIAQSLAHNLDVNKEDIQVLIKHSFDFSEFISQFVRDENGNTYSLSNILNLFQVNFEGTQHNAYDDALNLARLYQAMLDHPEIMKVEYKKVLGKLKHVPEPIHNVIIQLLENKNVSPQDFDKIIEESLR